MIKRRFFISLFGCLKFFLKLLKFKKYKNINIKEY